MYLKDVCADELCGFLADFALFLDPCRLVSVLCVLYDYFLIVLFIYGSESFCAFIRWMRSSQHFASKGYRYFVYSLHTGCRTL